MSEVSWRPVVDISEHQGAVDFAQMRAAGISDLILRASHGTTQDARVADYYPQAIDAGFDPRRVGFYSFINPKRGDGPTTATATATIIHDVTGRSDVLYMLDVESYRMQTPKRGTSPIAGPDFADYLRAHRSTFADLMAGSTTIGYTNDAYWSSSSGPRDPELAADLEWICPRYPRYSTVSYLRRGYPPEPVLWDEYAFSLNADGPKPPAGGAWSGWQFSAGYNRQGKRYGCSSSDLDLNIVRENVWQRWTNTTPEEDMQTVKTLWQPAGSENVYCLEDGLHISGEIRRAWKNDPEIHVIEITDDPHEGARASIEHRAGIRPPGSSLPALEVSWAD